MLMLISIAKSALIKPAGILLLVLNLGLFLVSFSGLLTAVDERSLYPLALINEHLQEQGRKKEEIMIMITIRKRTASSLGNLDHLHSI